MKRKQSALIFACIFLSAICLAIPASDVFAAKGGKGGGNAGSGNGGEDEAVYTAAGDLINAASIDSTNLNFQDIIFRPTAGFTFDLSGFPVADPGGRYCPGFAADTTGTLILGPGDSGVEGAAELRFSFQGQLADDGKFDGHYLNMQGTMAGDWPPTDVTTLTFTSWDLSASNKKSQRSDCEGEGDGVEVIIGIAPASP